MTPGLAGDVNNSIFQTNAYPLGRVYGSVPNSGTDFTFRNNYAGELGGLNQDYRAMMTNAATNRPTARTNGSTSNGKPSVSWISFAIIFVAFVFIARRYAPDGEQYALIKPNIINAIFVTFWTILILVFLKVIAGKIKEMKVPGLQSTADLILSA